MLFFVAGFQLTFFFLGGESKKFFRLEYISSNLDFHEFLLFAVELQFLKVGDILALRCDVLFFISSIGRFLDFDEFLLSAIAVSISVFWKLKKFLLYDNLDSILLFFLPMYSILCPECSGFLEFVNRILMRFDAFLLYDVLFFVLG